LKRWLVMARAWSAFNKLRKLTMREMGWLCNGRLQIHYPLCTSLSAILGLDPRTHWLSQQ
jgi:hypothetical protein